jgi:hypothetical protein
LNADQRLLLETYVTLFNQTNRQMDTLREIQRGIIEDIRTLANLQTNNNSNQNNHNNQNNNQNNNHNNHNNSRNRNNNTARDYMRRNYYGPTNTQAYEQPFRFDFFSNTTPTTENVNRTNYVNSLWNNFDNLYTNVIVRPTALEIQNATRSVVFSEIENPLNANCPISLEPFEENAEVTQIIGCGHIFHSDSLNSWFHRNVRCPVCRYDVRTQRVQENSDPTPIQGEVSEQPSVVDASNNELVDSITNLTENILTRLMNPQTGNRIRFHRAATQVTYDPSSNEIIFRGFY